MRGRGNPQFRADTDAVNSGLLKTEDRDRGPSFPYTGTVARTAKHPKLRNCQVYLGF